MRACLRHACRDACKTLIINRPVTTYTARSEGLQPTTALLMSAGTFGPPSLSGV